MTASWILVALLVSASLSSGCGAIHNGRYQEVIVVASPAGTEVTVDSLPGATYRTPTSVRLMRWRQHTLVARAQGYEEASAVVRSHIDWAAVVLDCLPWFLCAPLLIDWPLGAVYRLEPTTVRLDLEERKETPRDEAERKSEP
jgi:hypothetical protein